MCDDLRYRQASLSYTARATSCLLDASAAAKAPPMCIAGVPASGSQSPQAALQRRIVSDPQSVEHEVSNGSADFVHALAMSASVFRPEVHGAVVEAVLRLPWSDSEGLASAVLSFTIEVVSAVPAFVKPCVDALVLVFLPSEKVQADSKATVSAAVLQRSHDTLRDILRACPLSIRFEPADTPSQALPWCLPSHTPSPHCGE